MIGAISIRDGFHIDEHSTHGIYLKLAKEKDPNASSFDEGKIPLKKAGKETDPESIPFHTMKDAFIWAACIGFRSGKRHPISGKKRLIFRWAQCTQSDIQILKALAIAEAGDINVLQDAKAITTIAEEYANTGVHLLRDELLEGNSLPLWNLVDLLGQL